MLLGHERIKEEIEKGMISNFEIECLGGAGYDLRIGEAYRLKSPGYVGVKDRKTPEIERITSELLEIDPGEYILVETIESVNMPSDIAARVLNRSTLFRCGVSLFNALVDPGYIGKLTFGLKNISDQVFKLERGARIAQIVFERVEGKTIGYDGRYQGGKIV